MTKYVLQSGNVKKYPDKMTIYFNELFVGVRDTPNVLWCFFATEPEYRQERYETYIQLFTSYFPGRVIPANKMASRANFEEQMQWADVVLFQGGSTELLLQELTGFDMAALLEGKVVTGSSAGAHMLTQYSWDCDHRACGDGLAILPVKFGAHFYSDYGEHDPRGPIDWSSAKKELAEYGDTSLPVYALEEGEFIVIVK